MTRKLNAADLFCGAGGTSQGAGSVALPFLAEVNHGGERLASGINETLGTITAKNGRAIAMPWLSSFYGNETQTSASLPVPTITTKDRHSLVVALCRGPQDWPTPETDGMRALQRTMRELGVCDVLFRMLSNPELSAAQGFPQSYVFTGTKADVTRQIGNSVSPDVAEAITLALTG